MLEERVKQNREIDAFYDKKYTLDFIQKSYFTMKKLNGEIFHFLPTINIDVNNDTGDTISNKVYDLYTNLYSLTQIGEANFLGLAARYNPSSADLQSIGNSFIDSIASINTTLDNIKKNSKLTNMTENHIKILKNYLKVNLVM